ncbi:hypothetical protein [Sphingobium aquiterrae]|uniref:hypothetical protein n=1 Tax=Sphingobium aquiterrae TaxID=2038656 RepID=UPI00301B47E9
MDIALPLTEDRTPVRTGRCWVDAVLTAAVAALSLAFFYRFQIAQGFTHLFGDRYDGMIEIAIMQHWGNVLAGKEAWNTTAYFHPAADTLGYNDGYLLYGMIHAAGRAMGLSLLGAAELTHAAMKLAGFFGMLALLRRCCAVGKEWSLFGAALFTVADLTLQHANHGQLFTVAFVPWAALLAWRAGEALIARRRAATLAWGAGFAALFALWISTAFYLAWFFGLYLLLLSGAAFVMSGRAGMRGLGAALWQCRAPIIAIAGMGIFLLTPFLLVYLPKMAETGAHGYGAVGWTSFTLFDYVNVVPGNIVWGAPVQWLRETILPGLQAHRDRIFGMPLLLFLLALGAAWRQVRDRKDGPAYAWIGAALLLSWLLIFNLFGFSLWRIIHATIPGASGIRVLGRFNILLLVPAIMLVTMMLARMPRRTLALTLAALLLGEQVSLTAPVQLDKAEQLAMIAAIPAPPPACRAFAVTSTRPHGYAPLDPEGDRIYAHNVDAMVLAQWFARPTVNGVSTFNPPHWDFADPDAPDYRARIRRYAHITGLSGLCDLDVRRGRFWTPIG